MITQPNARLIVIPRRDPWWLRRAEEIGSALMAVYPGINWRVVAVGEELRGLAVDRVLILTAAADSGPYRYADGWFNLLATRFVQGTSLSTHALRI